MSLLHFRDDAFRCGQSLSEPRRGAGDRAGRRKGWMPGGAFYARRSARSALCRRSRCTDAKWTRSEEHTSELQSLMRISYAVFCLKKKTKPKKTRKKKH